MNVSRRPTAHTSNGVTASWTPIRSRPSLHPQSSIAPARTRIHPMSLEECAHPRTSFATSTGCTEIASWGSIAFICTMSRGRIRTSSSSGAQLKFFPRSRHLRHQKATSGGEEARSHSETADPDNADNEIAKFNRDCDRECVRRARVSMCSRRSVNRAIGATRCASACRFRPPGSTAPAEPASE